MNKKFTFADGFPFGKEFTREFRKTSAKYPVLSTCPVCHHELAVVKLHCDSCNTTLDGQFSLSKFNYLDTDKLYFIEVFVKNRGNIKAIEKEMNLSYPTIKKMLDDVIIGLGYTPESGEDNSQQPTPQPSQPDKPKLTRTEILDQLEKGTISVTEAIEKLGKI
jgi:hypothetical protein